MLCPQCHYSCKTCSGGNSKINCLTCETVGTHRFSDISNSASCPCV